MTKKKLIALLDTHNCELYEGENGKVDMVAPDGMAFESSRTPSICLIQPPAFGLKKPTAQEWKDAIKYASSEFSFGLVEYEE
jgi:hypothetical protein